MQLVTYSDSSGLHTSMNEQERSGARGVICSFQWSHPDKVNCQVVDASSSTLAAQKGKYIMSFKGQTHIRATINTTKALRQQWCGNLFSLYIFPLFQWRYPRLRKVKKGR